MQLGSMMIWLLQVIGRGRRSWKLVMNDLRCDLGSILEATYQAEGFEILKGIDLDCYMHGR